MDEKALEKVLNDKEFMVKLAQQTDLNEVKKMLDSVGIYLTDEELIQLRDAVQAKGEELQEADLQDVAGGNTAGRAIGTTAGTAAGGSLGLLGGASLAKYTAITGGLIGSKFGKTPEDKAKNAAIGALVTGITTVVVPTVGGAALGGWCGYKGAKRLEKI